MEHTAFGTLGSRLPRIGGMATMPSRRDSCRQALEAILPQVDRLYLYLDKYSSVPDDIASLPRVVPLIAAPGEPAAGASGKFLGLAAHARPCLYFCFDDDILYPPTYVDHMAAALRRHHYRALVGVHAGFWMLPVGTYLRDKRLRHFAADLVLDTMVDELGAGTMAFHSGSIELDVTRWSRNDMDDLMVMIEAIRQGVPRIAVRRPEGFLKAIAERQPDSLYQQALLDDTVQTQLLKAAADCYPDDWCMSG